jgi:hypothetical protein
VELIDDGVLVPEGVGGAAGFLHAWGAPYLVGCAISAVG